MESKYPRNRLNEETDTQISFYTPEFYPLDNFSAYAISIWDRDFATSEHAFQWKKFADIQAEIADEILRARSSHDAKLIAQRNKGKRLPGWAERKLSIMEEVLRAKFIQHEHVRQVLARTGNREIIENSPTDDFWGVGPNGNGRNELGKLWMKIRSEHF